MNPYQTTRRLLRELTHRPYAFLGALLLVFLVSSFQPLRPYLYRYIIDHPLSERNYSAFWLWGGILIGLTLLHALFQRLQNLATQRLSWSLIHDLRVRLFEKILRLQVPVLTRYSSGILFTRLMTDTQTLQSTLSETLLVIGSELLQLFILLVLMFVVDPFLALVTLFTLPLGLATSSYFSRKIRESFTRVRRYIGLMNAYLQELLRTRELAWALAIEDNLLRRFHRLNRQFYKSYRRTIGYFSFFFPAMDLVTIVGLIVVLGAGSYRLSMGETTIGTLVAFSLYLQIFFRPFRILADQVNSLQMGLVSADRIFRLLDHPAQEKAGGQTPAGPPPYALVARQVSFAYQVGEPVLENFSLQAHPGEVVALSAPTGSGKSTFFYLIMGYYQPQAGEIRLGDLSISDWDKEALRRHIAYIPQEPVLFEGTLRENLTLYEPFSDEDIWIAAEKIGIASYVSEWPLDMSIAPHGQNLSAGERQLVALWRAALRRPVLWLLDEPTAQIDPQTEALLYQSLRRLSEGAIVLLIAHRPQAHAYCDRVVSLPSRSAHAA
jgi:ATP-binding cassette subfamily B multidrug efflux pump